MRRLARVLGGSGRFPSSPRPSPSPIPTIPVPGSLRQAILDANGTPGPDTIAFNIPGAGVHTITPATALPDHERRGAIDGYSQPGLEPQHRSVHQRRAPHRDRRDRAGDGLQLRVGGGSTIQGLVDQPLVHRHPRREDWGSHRPRQLRRHRSDGHLEGPPTGRASIIRAGATDRRASTGRSQPHLGKRAVCATAASRSATEWRDPGQPHRHRCDGYVLVAQTESASRQRQRRRHPHRRPHGGRGQRHLGQPFGQGGSRGTSPTPRVKGNLIGTNAAATAPLGNGVGIYTTFGSAHLVGGIGAGEGNVVAYNSARGLVFTGNGGSNNARGNSIHDNGGLGIDIGTTRGPTSTIRRTPTTASITSRISRSSLPDDSSRRRALARTSTANSTARRRPLSTSTFTPIPLARSSRASCSRARSTSARPRSRPTARATPRSTSRCR